MALLDLDHLKKIIGDDPAFIRQILQIFIRNTPEDMAALTRAVEKGSHEQVSFYAHKLKSAAGAIGYNEAYEDFKVLEGMGKELGPISEIEAHVNKLNAECSVCMVEIEQIMNSL